MVQISAATLSGNSLRQTVHTHRASVHKAAKLVVALLRVAGVTAGLAEIMAAYRRVYDSRHLQADCQEPGSAPEPYARRSSTSYLYIFVHLCLRRSVHWPITDCSTQGAAATLQPLGLGYKSSSGRMKSGTGIVTESNSRQQQFALSASRHCRNGRAVAMRCKLSRLMTGLLPPADTVDGVEGAN